MAVSATELTAEFNKKNGPSKRKSRVLQRFCTVAILLLVIMEALAQQIAPAPPGKLVDVDGTRLHIDCTGPQRGPSVILISGIGDYSFDWELVQPRLGSSNQVCS